jgi:hypothetical protein
MKSLLLIFILLLPVSVCAQSNLQLISQCGRDVLDAERYPANVQAGIDVLNSKCYICHSLSRLTNALETGRTESGESFGKSDIKSFVIKKMRRPDVNISKQEASEIMKVLEYILNEGSESKISSISDINHRMKQ